MLPERRQISGSFAEALAHGRKVEILVGNWLMGRGFHVLPTYDYSGAGSNKAPKFQALDPRHSLVIPDILTSRLGTMKWVEVKYKSRADIYRKTGIVETGIDLRLWKHYVRVETLTGAPVWLVFAHKHERELIGQSISMLATLGAREYTGNKMGHGGMMFFPYNKMIKLAKFTETGDAEVPYRISPLPFPVRP